MLEYRKALKSWLGQRVQVTATLDKFSLLPSGIRINVTALCQVVECEWKEVKRYVGHVWMQHAEKLKESGVLPGQRFSCTCVVGKYQKALKDQGPNKYVEDFNVSYPENITIINAERAPVSEEMKPEEEWVSTSEAAELLGVTGETIRRWADDGRIKTRPRGPKGVWRECLLSDLIRFSEETERPTPAPVEVPPAPQAAQQNGATLADLIGALKRVKELSGQVGGLENLVEIAQLLK